MGAHAAGLQPTGFGFAVPSVRLDAATLPDHHVVCWEGPEVWEVVVLAVQEAPYSSTVPPWSCVALMCRNGRGGSRNCAGSRGSCFCGLGLDNSPFCTALHQHFSFPTTTSPTASLHASTNNPTPPKASITAPSFAVPPPHTQKSPTGMTPASDLVHSVPSQLPYDFVQTTEHWDNRQVLGLNLPRYIQTNPHTIQNRTAGLPIATAPQVSFLGHNWSSYWLRYAAHGGLTLIRSPQHTAGLARKPAMTQLVKELVLYMQELQDNYNDSTKKQKLRMTNQHLQAHRIGTCSSSGRST